MGISKRCKTTDDRNVVLDHEGVKYETDKAKLFYFGKEEIWISKSLIEYEDESTLEIPRWLADQKGLT